MKARSKDSASYAAAGRFVWPALGTVRVSVPEDDDPGHRPPARLHRAGDPDQRQGGGPGEGEGRRRPRSQGIGGLSGHGLRSDPVDHQGDRGRPSAGNHRHPDHRRTLPRSEALSGQRARRSTRGSPPDGIRVQVLRFSGDSGRRGLPRRAGTAQDPGSSQECPDRHGSSRSRRQDRRGSGPPEQRTEALRSRH